jgi:DNA-binding transcriptional MerR regulator
MKSGELSALLGIDKSTLFNWLEVPELQKFISAGALGTDGATQRTFTETDLQVLNTVRLMKAGNRRRPWSEIIAQLESGELMVDVPTHTAVSDPRTVPLQLAEQSARVMALNEKIEALQRAVAERDELIQYMRKESAEIVRMLREDADKRLEMTREDAEKQLEMLREDAEKNLQRIQSSWERERGDLQESLKQREAEILRLNERLLAEIKEVSTEDVNLYRQMGRMEGLIDQLKEEIARLKAESGG